MNCTGHEIVRFAPSAAGAVDTFGKEIVGRSSPLRAVLRKVELVAPTTATVLIHGETGTGKELIARAVHVRSPRCRQPFIKIDCAAIPAALLESELFGHERGAFTGAIARKLGRFELANGGTLFLDEVGDIPLELQPKLLRALQEHECERLGGTQTRRLDIRIVAATCRDLPRMVAEQQFRRDLYYRLNVFPLCAPPLRERGGDIPFLVRHFLKKYAGEMNRRVDTIRLQTLDLLARHDWPGNIRELENLVERGVILSRGRILHLPLSEVPPTPHCSEAINGNGDSLETCQREHILKTLGETHWIVGGPNGAAARLGLKRTTLISKMEKLGIARKTKPAARETGWRAPAMIS